MSDWPQIDALLGPVSVLSSFSIHSVNQGGLTGAPSSTAWAANNLALYVPFRIARPIVVTKLFVMNGATASGNVDMGIYDTAGTRLVSIGSTAQSGTNAVQAFDITDTELGPGAFYLALALSSTSGTVFMAASMLANHCKMIGMAEQTSAFALPATATFASCSNTGVPFIGLATQATV